MIEKNGYFTFTDTTAYVEGVDQGGLEGVPEQAYSLTFIYLLENIPLRATQLNLA